MIFRLGRLLDGGARGPGIFFIIPCVDSYTKASSPRRHYFQQVQMAARGGDNNQDYRTELYLPIMLACHDTGCSLNMVSFPYVVILLNSASSAAALAFYLPGVCILTLTPRENRERPEYFKIFETKHNI